MLLVKVVPNKLFIDVLRQTVIDWIKLDKSVPVKKIQEEVSDFIKSLSNPKEDRFRRWNCMKKGAMADDC